MCDIYECPNKRLTIWNYIGQVHATHFIGEVTNVIPGKEEIVDWVSKVIMKDENRKMCYRIRFGDPE